MRIAPLLRVGRGLTALIGSGGKTTLLLALARELRGRGSVLICTSTHIRIPEGVPLTNGGADEVRDALARHGVVCAAAPAEEEGKLTAPALPFETLTDLADYVLVEADGSRGLPIKAHAPHEPVIPANAQRVVTVLGAEGFHRSAREVCHRYARWAELAGVSPDAPVTPEAAARVLRAEGLGDRLYINQVENAAAYGDAASLSEKLDCPVVAGSLWKEVFVCLR